MCLASVSFAHVTEIGPSMQILSVLISALTGCLSFNGLLQILPAHSPHSSIFSLLFLLQKLLLLGVLIKSILFPYLLPKG